MVQIGSTRRHKFLSSLCRLFEYCPSHWNVPFRYLHIRPIRCHSKHFRDNFAPSVLLPHSLNTSWSSSSPPASLNATPPAKPFLSSHISSIVLLSPLLISALRILCKMLIPHIALKLNNSTDCNAQSTCLTPFTSVSATFSPTFPLPLFFLSINKQIRCLCSIFVFFIQETIR